MTGMKLCYFIMAMAAVLCSSCKIIIVVGNEPATEATPTKTADTKAITGLAAPVAAGLFKDAKLEAAVRKALDKPVGVLAANDLVSMEKLEVSFLGITDITGLEHATNLTSLNISHNPISDITPLAGLTKLKRLLIYKIRISDLKPLADLTQVEFVTFWETSVSDLTPLKLSRRHSRRARSK